MKRTGKTVLAILQYVATGVAVYAAFGSPSFTRKFYARLGKKLKRQASYYLRRKLSELEKDGYVTLGPERIRLTKKGRLLLKQYESPSINVDDMKWDKVWRIVAYDIPNTKSKQRNIFRQHLRNLGFTQIQKSIFVFPYECKEEIAILARQSTVEAYVLYLHASYLPQQSELKKHYSL